MRLPIVAALMALAAGCGQKGPLYLSNQPPPGVKPAKEVYKPVPYPKKSEPGNADAAK
jgi:predicted small lipoprotein YifL